MLTILLVILTMGVLVAVSYWMFHDVETSLDHDDDDVCDRDRSRECVQMMKDVEREGEKFRR